MHIHQNYRFLNKYSEGRTCSVPVTSLFRLCAIPKTPRKRPFYVIPDFNN